MDQSGINYTFWLTSVMYVARLLLRISKITFSYGVIPAFQSFQFLALNMRHNRSILASLCTTLVSYHFCLSI